jgi:transposase
LQRHVLGGEKLHADDTPVLVLQPGRGTTKTGRLWTCVRDDRNAPRVLTDQPSAELPAVWFAYSPARKGCHPQRHLKDFRGILQADGYAGYERLYATGEITRAACWAHARRKFFGSHAFGDKSHHQTPIATAIVKRIGVLYVIEAHLRGKAPDQRRRIRQLQTKPRREELRQFFETTLALISRKSDPAEAIRYALARYTALSRFIDDGRIEIDNNAAERAPRCVVLGRKSFLFAGSDKGGERGAAIYSLIGTAKLNRLDPEPCQLACVSVRSSLGWDTHNCPSIRGKFKFKFSVALTAHATVTKRKAHASAVKLSQQKVSPVNDFFQIIWL